MSEYKQYRRKSISEMRPYIVGELLSDKVSISQADMQNGSPKAGDMIARNPKNHDDQWLVAKEYFEDNLEPIEENDCFHLLNRKVFLSPIKTIGLKNDDGYGGAHRSSFINRMGFKDGEAQHDFDNFQVIQFVQKNEDGTMIPGVQSEQLLIALIDRHKKLNEKFPSREGALAITKMEEALHWLEAMVRERIERGVMGDLKK